MMDQIQNHFVEKQLTLSLAESCTGGALSAKITSLAGCSEYFLGSIISYSNELKVHLLGVKEETLKAYGAVSAEVVKEMVEGILQLTGSDYAIAISGIAGPGGGTGEKPVGTMWGAIGKKGEKPHIWHFHHEGDRQAIIEKAVDTLLSELYQNLVKI